jgi:hypothetical protein
MTGCGLRGDLGGEGLKGLVGLLAGDLVLSNLAEELALGEVVDSLHGASVEEVLVRDPEDLRHLVVVVEHHCPLLRLAVRLQPPSRRQRLGFRV